MKIKLPDTFNIDSSEKYILAIEISVEGYSFSMYNPVEDGSFFYHKVESGSHTDPFSAFKDFFFENEFLAYPFRKVFVINKTSEFTFIPKDVFEEKDKESFFSFNFPESENKVLIQTLWKPELVILHSLQEDVFEFFSRSFLKPSFIHHLSPLLSYFQERSRLGNAHKMIINLHETSLDVLCFSPSGDFMMANSFSYNHLNDAVYYIFFIWKQFKMNQLRDFVYVAGNSSQKVKLIEQVQKYVQNVIPVNITLSEHFFGTNIQAVPFEFLSLTLCGL